jgi:hypothetical protein
VLGLAWLFAIACLTHGIARRATSGTAVLMIDQSGILDLRLMPRRIGWQSRLSFPSIDRSRVVDASLRQPNITLAGTRGSRARRLCPATQGAGDPISMLLRRQVADG